jgi:hypothetical protein
MRVFREPEPDRGNDVLTFALGAMGGLAIGLLLTRRAAPERIARVGSGIRERAENVARRLRPARLRRVGIQLEDLSRLEDLVIDAFVRDDVLGARGVDIGAISPGIIELSGAVDSEEESERAVRVASAIPGVRTVVNRLDVDPHYRPAGSRGGDADDQEGSEWTGRRVGMGTRRQGRQTDKHQTDDSQSQEAKALRDADLHQYGDENVAYEQPRVQRRPDVPSNSSLNYSEEELDNQDPHGKHAAYTLDEPPQELRTTSRVGEGLKSGEHLALEKADVPVKPHGGMNSQGESSPRN